MPQHYRSCTPGCDSMDILPFAAQAINTVLKEDLVTDQSLRAKLHTLEGNNLGRPSSVEDEHRGAVGVNDQANAAPEAEHAAVPEKIAPQEAPTQPAYTPLLASNGRQAGSLPLSSEHHDSTPSVSPPIMAQPSASSATNSSKRNAGATPCSMLVSCCPH